MEEQLEDARELLKQKRYEEAREILEEIDYHPTAQKWLAQLDEIEGPSSMSLLASPPASPLPEKRKNSAPISPKQKTKVSTVDARLAKARRLIEEQKYQEAQALLLTVDHPTADKWLARLAAMGKTTPQMQTNVIVNQQQNGPGCVMQFLWFVFVGWWAAQLWIGIAWFAMLTIIGVPLAIFMINRVSGVIALRPSASARNNQTRVTVQDGTTTVEVGAGTQQINLLVRIFWFLAFGWWLSAIWMEIAYLLCFIIIGLPLGLRMFDYTPTVLTLRR